MKVNKFIIRMTILSNILLIFSVIGLAQEIRFKYITDMDFSKYRTYRWVRVEKAEYPDQLLDEQIRSAIDRQLLAKGLIETENGFSDLVVTYQLAIDEEKKWQAYRTGDANWRWGWWSGWGSSLTTITSSIIYAGTINLDIYDVAMRNQVWRGEATKTLKNPKNPAKLQKNIEKAMAKLLQNFPP